MDFDADGRLDLVSGSYDPGDLHLFRGTGPGEFAPPEVIKDQAGRPILEVPDQKAAVESFGSWMTTVDWEADGDLDILVGTFEGRIFLRRNEGTRARPSYATENEWVTVGDKPLRVPGGEHANPVAADWDADGRWDIVTGAGDGGAYWYRNVGPPDRPEFRPPVALVPPHEGIGYNELLEPGAEPRPGIRSQIAVTDYDGDGRLDLLLGDFRTTLHVRGDLSPDDRLAFDAARRAGAAATTSLRGRMDALRAEFKAAMAGVPEADWNTPENQAKWQEMYAAMRESADYKRDSAAYERAQEELRAFLDPEVEGMRLGDDPAVSHGYVWLFRRKG